MRWRVQSRAGMRERGGKGAGARRVLGTRANRPRARPGRAERPLPGDHECASRPAARWRCCCCSACKNNASQAKTVQKTMSSPPLRGTAEWSATREVALLLGLTGGNRYAAQQLWLRKERIKAEASQVASAGPPQASQQPAGYRAKPAPAQAQAVPKQRTPAQLARNERSRERLFQKHLAKVAKVHPMLQAWLRRARASLGQPMELQPVPPATPTRPSVAVPESGAGQPPFQAEVVNLPCLAGTQSDLPNARLLSITAMAAYQDKSFEELRWEHYSKGNVLEARPPAEPPAAAQPAPPSQQPSTALVAAARASLDASDLQDDRGSKRDTLARTPPPCHRPRAPSPPR